MRREVADTKVAERKVGVSKVNETEFAGFVRDKFAAISPRYDLLNSVLSLGIDASWRRAVARELPPSYPLVLDLCAGTLPLSRELLNTPGRRVVALDFCHAMLVQGRDRLKLPIPLLCADGQLVPLRSGSVDGVTVAFGVRNLASPAAGLAEMQRVLRPGGRAVILEFSRPTSPLFGPLYRFYLGRVLPVVGGMISGDREAYGYLASSIGAFMEPNELAALMRGAGFRAVRYRRLTMGIVTMHVGDK
jgi:demethylmenaquinone methyltransferase/2-methoxy-6-polyprenyl-1,4-benzoquinol methylase